jgi:hypothetical protein
MKNPKKALFNYLMGCLILTDLYTLASCKTLATKTYVTVQADDFQRPTRVAMSIINAFVGCEFLVSGGAQVRVLSIDAEPCGETFHHAIEDGHAGTSYACKDGRSEVHVSFPGNTHDQVCIIAHELGHIAGLADHRYRGQRGIMNQYDCPTPIVLSDYEVGFMRRKFCR